MCIRDSPEGVTTLKGGTRVEFGIVEGRRGAQALSVKVLDLSLIHISEPTRPY